MPARLRSGRHRRARARALRRRTTLVRRRRVRGLQARDRSALAGDHQFLDGRRRADQRAAHQSHLENETAYWRIEYGVDELFEVFGETKGIRIQLRVCQSIRRDYFLSEADE